jgi:NitT/TauT family transport system permease protein
MNELIQGTRVRSSARVQRGRKGIRVMLRWVVRIGSVLTCLWLWQIASVHKWSLLGARFENVPAPAQVFEAAKDLLQSPKVSGHLKNSLTRIFAGFSIAAVFAIVVGLLVGRSRWAEDGMMPPLEVLRPIPAVAWIPLAILLWPTAESSMIFITFIGAFFPVLLNTIHGVECIDRRLIQASRVLGANRLALFKEVILPGALPAIVTGLSIGMGTSWFSLITAEMVSGQFGIGYFTWEAYTLQNYPDIVLGMVLIGILGTASSVLIKVAGNRLMPWHKLGGQSL